jgi:ribonucleoside-triphosphate reductase (thioredoxin)
MIVSFPIDVGKGVRTVNEVSMWEQLSLAALLQRHWADNQVSCTVTFDPISEGIQIKYALDYFQYSLKGVRYFLICIFVYINVNINDVLNRFHFCLD